MNQLDPPSDASLDQTSYRLGLHLIVSSYLGRGVAGEPEAEVWVASVGTEVLADLLQHGHPGHGQVAVLQTHPRPLLHGGRDQPGSDGTLVLPQGDDLELGTTHPLDVGKLQQAWRRRRTSRID